MGCVVNERDARISSELHDAFLWREYLDYGRDPFAVGSEHFGEGAVLEAAARCEQVRTGETVVRKPTVSPASLQAVRSRRLDGLPAARVGWFSGPPCSALGWVRALPLQYASCLVGSNLIGAGHVSFSSDAILLLKCT